MRSELLMKAIPPAKIMALAILFCLFAHPAQAQTPQQLAEINSIGENDWIYTLDYCGWLLDARFWIDHPDSEYAKPFFADLNLSAADDAAFRTIVADFNTRDEQLMADHYAKLESNEWTPEAQSKLIHDLIDATNDAIHRIKTNLSPDGTQKFDSVFHLTPNFQST